MTYRNTLATAPCHCYTDRIAALGDIFTGVNADAAHRRNCQQRHEHSLYVPESGRKNINSVVPNNLFYVGNFAELEPPNGKISYRFLLILQALTTRKSHLDACYLLAFSQALFPVRR
jgi:hypothetical protein